MIARTIVRVFCAALLAASTTGCLHALKGGPESVLNEEVSTSDKTAKELALTRESGKTDEGGEKARNKVITERLMMIDGAYSQYVRRLQQEQTIGNLSADLADLALGIAGTLTGSSGVKTNYAAASALLAGSSASINRRAFFEQTTTALVSAMNAFRAKVRLRILESSKQSLGDYPPEEVYYDLSAYEFAGTLPGAISYVQSTADKEKTAVEVKIDENVRNIYNLTDSQRVTKRCLTMSLGKTNAGALTRSNLRDAGKRLDPPLSMGDETQDTMIQRLQQRIRDATPSEVEAIGKAFSAAQIKNCEGS